MNFDVTDSAVASQRAPLPAPQVVSWRVDELSVSNVAAVDGSYSFLYRGACFYQLNASAPLPFSTACHTSGLTLPPATGIPSASFRITLSRLDVRGAARPDLSASADPDGDGIPNGTDNCPIVYNPDQANVNAGQETIPAGDACSDPDASGSPTIADQDQDGVPDVARQLPLVPEPHRRPARSFPADSDGTASGMPASASPRSPCRAAGSRSSATASRSRPKGSRISLFPLGFRTNGRLDVRRRIHGLHDRPVGSEVGSGGNDDDV